MNDFITAIRLAFVKWKIRHRIKMNDVCISLVNKHGRGYDYATINDLLPFTAEKVLEKDDAARFDKKKTFELLHKIELILEETNFSLLDFDENRPDTILDENGDLRLTKSSTTKKGSPHSYPDNHYFFYYIRANKKLSKDHLIIDLEGKKVHLSTERHSKANTGTIETIDDTVYLMKFGGPNEERTRYWNITFYKSNDGSDLHIATYHKVVRNQHSIGEAILIKANTVAAELVEANDGDTSASETLAWHYLHKKRYQRQNGNFNIHELIYEKNREAVDIPAFNAWHSLQVFCGTWEGYFVNPFSKSFENCVIRIDKNGLIKMWIQKNIAEEYHGICTRMNDLLIIHYDWLREIEAYRSSIVVSITGHNGDLFDKDKELTTIKGVLGCIEREKNHPVATRIALRKMNHKPMDRHESGIELSQLPLNKFSDLKKFRQKLKELKLASFFFGGSGNAVLIAGMAE
jgi:hypothetical protein